MNNIKILFPEGKKKAFTMSYDDGVIQDKRLICIMNKYGIKGTFNLNSGFVGKKERVVIDGYDTDVSKISEDEISYVYSGQEISCHGLTHMNLKNVNTLNIINEIIDDKKKLEGITKKIIKGFAYPFGIYDNKIISILEICGISYARTINRTGSFEIPDNFMEWNPTCHHNDLDLMKLIKQFCNESSLLDESRLFYLWGHSYEFDQKENWYVIEEAFSYLNKYKDKIWTETNGKIVEYINDFYKLEYSADRRIIYNPTAQNIWIEINGKKLLVKSGETITDKGEIL